MRAIYERGMTPTNHTDFSVIPLDPTMPIWSAMKRETRTGKILDADQRVTAEQALKAMSINGAIQYREENLKGSLEVGKLADMVIFDRNPLKVPVDEIRKLRIVQTIKEGKTVFPSH
jgi:predicted amidohydrolase YtcJ